MQTSSPSPAAASVSQAPGPAVFVIFGITGDLAGRKLLPALYHLFKDDLLDPRTVVLGITRRPVTEDQLLQDVELCVNETEHTCDPAAIGKLRRALRMHQMDPAKPDDYDSLRGALDAVEAEAGVCMNRLYYLSIPPQTFADVVRNLGMHGLNGSCGHGTAASRLLVEKPFGYDIASARELVRETGEWFDESQLFRIDHYLAKETVQNVLAFRMFNPIFTDQWSRGHITSVVITAYEKIDIEGRAAFYEDVGALRDFIQSHLLQLLAVVVMELPADLSSEAVHHSKLALLQAIRPIAADEVAVRAVRGQYQGYAQEVGNPDSITETYAELNLLIDSPVWEGVPMTLRSGKALAEKRTDVSIRFKGRSGTVETYNDLVFRIQPSEGISLKLIAKKPGFDDRQQQVNMDFKYQYDFDSNGHPDAYERVLVDAARGDHTLFTTSDEVMAAWSVIEHVQKAWAASGDGLVIYPKGSEGVQAPDAGAGTSDASVAGPGTDVDAPSAK